MADPADDRAVMDYRSCDRGFGPNTNGLVLVVYSKANVMAMPRIRYTLFRVRCNGRNTVGTQM